MTIYETELVEESQPNTEIEILQLKTRDFNRKLQEDKENINLWLEFVDFQDDIFQYAIFHMQNIHFFTIDVSDCFFIIEQNMKSLWRS